jgi:hypothetical protein
MIKQTKTYQHISKQLVEAVLCQIAQNSNWQINQKE